MKSTISNSFAGVIDYRQAMIGVLCLLLGVVVYLIARPAGVAFLPDTLNFGRYFPASLIRLTGPLPVFLHVLGLSLLTASILSATQRNTLLICLGWAGVNILFECGQYPPIRVWLVERLAGLQDVWLLEHIPRYFQYGSFDILDLLFSLLGAGVAYVLIRHTRCPHSAG